VQAKDGSKMAGRRTRNLIALWEDETTHDQAPPAPPQCFESSSEGISMAFRTLQYLPIPLLVLSDQKTIVLANQAMGEYLGLSIRENSCRIGGEYCSSGVTEILYGKTLNGLGFDVYGEDATLFLVSWELYLDSLAWGIGPGDKLKDTKMDVHVPMTKTQQTWQSGKEAPKRRTQMTISPWRGPDGDMYYTCTLRTVASKQSAPVLEPPTSGTMGSVVESSLPESKCEAVPRQAPGLTMAQKMAALKEALIDFSEIPVFALWYDASIAGINHAGFELVNPSNLESMDYSEPFDRIKALKTLKAYLPDFSQELPVNESPLSRIMMTRKPLDSMLIGMYIGGKKRIVDVSGKCIYDNNGEFAGALVAMHDVTKITEMQYKLDTEAQRNEEHFRNILDCIPQMVWPRIPLCQR
jgi:hypothetical protein